jgi:hypothetical protein
MVMPEPEGNDLASALGLGGGEPPTKTLEGFHMKDGAFEYYNLSHTC